MSADSQTIRPPARSQRQVFWLTMAVLSVAVALVSYRYLAAVGPVAPNVIGNLFAKPWLLIHITGAATALLVGAFQFLPRLRARRRAWHRWIGRLYVVGCIVGGVAGLVIAFGATAGPVATVGFGTLALLWIACTVQAWRMARQRRFEEHRAWMIRSWALTLAAVTLRLYLPLAIVLPIPFMDGYRAISFLCWVPNLAAAEFYLRRRVVPAT